MCVYVCVCVCVCIAQVWASQHPGVAASRDGGRSVDVARCAGVAASQTPRGGGGGGGGDGARDRTSAKGSGTRPTEDTRQGEESSQIDTKRSPEHDQQLEGKINEGDFSPAEQGYEATV